MMHILALMWYALHDSFAGPILVAILVMLAMAGVTAYRFLRFLLRSVTRI